MGSRTTSSTAARDMMWSVVMGSLLVIGLPLLIAATHFAVG